MLQNTTQCIPVHFTILQEQKKRGLKEKRKGLSGQNTDVKCVHYLASLNILLLCSEGPAYHIISSLTFGPSVRHRAPLQASASCCLWAVLPRACFTGPRWTSELMEPQLPRLNQPHKQTPVILCSRWTN